MSLLNLTNDGIPNILVVLYATLAKARSPMTAQELLDTVAPDTVVRDQRLARATLNRWIELGLFKVKPAAETLTLDRVPETDMKSETDIVRAVRVAARRVALSKENNEDLWAQEEARAADLSRSLAWLLAQDVYRLGDQNLFTLASDHLIGTNATLMQNEARVSGLKSWGHFLGFIRHAGAVEVDPTLAIVEVLPQCIAPGEEMPARDLVERIAQALPVIDGGTYRVAVQSRLRANALPPLQAGQLSTSLSRAMFGFLLDQSLQFENRADSGSSIVLTGRDGLRADHRYSWVRRPRGSAR